LDNGCDRSLIAANLVEYLPKRATTVRLLTANSTAVPLVVETDIKFIIECVRVTADVAISPAIDGIILRGDWLMDNDCNWHFGKSELTIWGQVIKTRSQQPRCYVRRVYIAKNSTLLPHCQSDVPIRLVLHGLAAPPSDWAIIEPKELKHGVITARTVLNGENTDAVVQTINYLDKSFTIPTDIRRYGRTS